MVASGEPFGIAYLPGESIPFGQLEAGRWLAPYSERLIPGQTDTYSLPCCRKPGSHETETGGLESYVEAVKKVIASCAARNGKTVFSREITGATGEGVTAGNIFERLCDKFPDTFRYIFHIPGEGVWMGATPEILLDVDLRTGAFSTMALAGTRVTPPTAGPWDEKNVIEHKYVSDFIAATLRDAGVSFEESPLTTLPYGRIEHLCRYFHGNLGEIPYPVVLDSLNPTPALCGTPKEEAIADITRCEPHDRGFYGGFVAVRTAERFVAYANLRCLKLDGDRFSVYAGGGITALSDPCAEFAETEAKAAPRLELLHRKPS
ncbi:MAG: chorismate-binding protein [Muribaculaceae bacterium]|nr:chorismate-binding protein [Muribaculaceae bacterium]